ncbi:MAG: hypothetical protein AAB835_00880 [Patescibacteria group bacterium]
MKISLVESAATVPEDVYQLNLPTRTIGVLQQVRSRMTRDGLEHLMASIKEIGQKTAGVVIGLSAEEAEKYLQQVNDLWGTSYRICDFEPVHFSELNGNFYLFLVTGHRRLTAVKKLEIGTYLTELHLQIQFLDAFILQFHENIHEEVAKDDEARFLTVMWRKQKSMDEGLSLSEFARRHGKTSEAVRRAVRFTSLPVSVQKLVLPSEEYKKGVAFGILCELARLQEARQTKDKPYTEQDLVHLAYVLVVQQKTVKAAAMWVSAQIQELQGQGNMFELSIQHVVDGARRSVVSGLEYDVRIGSEHMRAIARMHKDGGIRKVASGAAVNAVTNAVNLTTKLAPDILDGIKGARHAPIAREALKKVGT